VTAWCYLAAGASSGAAATYEAVVVARRPDRDRLIIAWMIVTAAGATACVLAPVQVGRVSLGWVALILALALFVAMIVVLGRSRAGGLFRPSTVRMMLDVVAVGAAAGALWFLVRMRSVDADGAWSVVQVAEAALGMVGAAVMAYAVVGPAGRAVRWIRLTALFLGAGLLVLADDMLREGANRWWSPLLCISAGIGFVAFRVLAEMTAPVADGQSSGDRDAGWPRAGRWDVDSQIAAGDQAPILPGIVEGTLWVLIVVFQVHRSIELVTAGAAVVAALAISLRSMARSAEQARRVESLHMMATTDPLTGLLNRRGFAQAITDIRRGAVALIDLDGFKRVNDRLGHTTGDQLLRAIAVLGPSYLPVGATLARLGGDEFGLVVPGPVDDAMAVAERLVSAIADVRFAGHVTASAGVAEITSDTEESLRNAGFALHWAKRAGPGKTLRLSPAMLDAELRRTQLAEALAADLERGNLEVAYQPIVRLADRAVLSVEALARWRHRTYGEVSPDEFVAIAEELGLIDRLGDLMLELVIGQSVAWEAAGHSIEIALNVSGLQLRGPDFAERIAARVDDAGIRGRVSIEVTESAIVDDASLRALTDLKAHGFRCAIDDFGTGYASVDQVVRLDPDRLKIDRRFISALGASEDRTSRVIVEAVIGLAHRLGVEVVAEGVETQRALDILVDLGCDHVQGFLLGRPDRAEAIEALLGVRVTR
jgi:diguanylate cyclase (GGDEF)-like protein